ncbi:MAG: HEAT repeat domain-containing protein [Polyangiaceae bacterium]|nr:HEAT repeat domain-containing protein [Polyangiaceae bacterium]
MMRAGVLLVAGLLLTTPAFSQPDPRGPAPRTPTPPAAGSLVSRLGIETASRKLTSSKLEERLEALERLGTIGSPRALAELTRALDPGGSAGSVEERLIAVRSLAPHARTSTVRLSLMRALGGAPQHELHPLAPLVTQTAALALAKAGDRDALALLGQALRQQGPAAEAARAALVAHPPRDLRPIVSGRGAPTLALVQTLGELGDQRAFNALREFARRGTPEIRGAAALELTRLGGYETVALAKTWLGPTSAPALVRAATTILALSADPAAHAEVARRLAIPDDRLDALTLAELSPSAAFAAPLASWLPTARTETAARIVNLLVRTNTDSAWAAIARALKRDETRSLAARALANAPSPRARELLESELGSASGAAWAVRAGALRQQRVGDAPRGLDDAIERLLHSSRASERAAAAWSAVLLTPSRFPRLAASSDPAVLAAVARHGHHGTAAEVLAASLSDQPSVALRAALSMALASDSAGQLVSTSVLSELLDDGGGAALLAARALAKRDSAVVRPKLEELLETGSPDVRAHVALGLGSSEDPTALGLLESIYRLEAEPRVRRAAVLGLGGRPEATRSRTLRLAAELDPDAGVRSAARQALSGHPPSALPRGSAVVWLELAETSGFEGGPRAVSLASSTGLSLPAVCDADGAVLIAGLPEGPVELTISAAPLPASSRSPKAR